jgi:hypothetical protein
MKTLIKLTLVVCLFGSVALADGDIPGGNYQCPPEGCPPPPCTVDCGGGNAMFSDDTDTTANTSDVIFAVVESGVEDALLFVY